MQNLHVSETAVMFSVLMVLTDFEATEMLPSASNILSNDVQHFLIIKKIYLNVNRTGFI